MATLLSKLKPMNSRQKELMEILTSKDYDIVGVFGLTGTGKSLFACIYGIDGAVNGLYSRFVISRPVADVISGKELTAIDIGELYYRIAASYYKTLSLKMLLAGVMLENSLMKKK